MATGSAWADCRSGRGTLFRTRRGRRLAELGYAIDKRSIEHIGTRRQRMTNVLETTSFGATSTTDDVLSGVNLSGKRILVTGVSAGLGVETARSLVANGGQVVGAARDLNKAKTATEQVRKDAAANGGSFDLVEIDLASLKERACPCRRVAGEGRCIRCGHRQCWSDGHTVRPHRRWLRNAV